MGLHQSLRVVTGALLPAYGLQFTHANSGPHTVVFGIAPGPYSDMMKQAIAPMLREKGYKVVVHEFSDYVQLNIALSNGSIDTNLFRHLLYSGKSTANKGLKLSELIVVPAAGMGFYSHKIKSLGELKKGDAITFSNDPTNPARGLRFLQFIGLITIKDNIDPTKASERDIANNPKGLVFKPLEAARLPHTLGGMTGALVNGSSTVTVKMDLAGVIEQEHPDENLKNIIVVRSEDADKPFARNIVGAVKSPTYRAVIGDLQNIYSTFQKSEWMSTAQ